LPISSSELRSRFNAGRYLNRAAHGEFVCCLKDVKRPSSPDETPGTLSYIVGYLDSSGKQVFLVHLYLRPNGDIGGSGREDPKWLLDDEAIFYGSG
jgi:hypothetical protein